MNIVYVGPFDEGIELPTLNISVRRGVIVDVDEGAALALLAQHENFATPDAPRAVAAIADRARIDAERAAASTVTDDGSTTTVTINQGDQVATDTTGDAGDNEGDQA